MILTTTPTIEGYPVKQYLGVVASETIIGANVFRDIMAGLRDFFGGRSSSYEEVLKKQRTLRCKNCKSAQPQWALTPS